jgi:hypothetical protein
VTIVRVGSNQKYAEGWDQVFGGKKGKKKAAKPAPKKAAKKKAKK